MSAAAVAQMGYRGFQDNRRVVITGARNRTLAHLVSYLPRSMVLSMVNNLQSPAS